MKVSNLRLLQMHPACSIKKALNVFFCITIACSFAGCQKQIETISTGEWIKELADKAGISEFRQEEPYFVNVPVRSDYYTSVQACVEWQVLDPLYELNPDDPLNREWAADTLMNLTGIADEGNAKINDIGKSPFQAQIKAAVSLGYFETDFLSRFHPKDIVSRKDAEKLLEKTLEKINSRTFENKEPNIKWKENRKFTDVQPISFDEAAMEGTFSDSYIQPGDVLHWKQNENEKWYTAIDAKEENGCVTVQCEKFNPLDDMEELELSGNDEIDFSKSSLETEEGLNLQNTVKEDASRYLTTMSVLPLTKEFSFQGYKISLSVNGSSVIARAARTMPYGTEISAGVMMNHVHVNYAWNSKEHDLKNAYFKLDFDSDEDTTVENEKVKKLYSDFSKTASNDFLDTFKHIFLQNNDAEDAVLTLCRITVPLPNAPVLSLHLSLELHLSACGKAQLLLKQENGVGFETRNGMIRMIKENKGDAQASIKGSTKILASIRFGLQLLHGTLMDAGVNAGAEGIVKTTVHAFDEAGNMKDTVTSYPDDLLESAAEKNPDILVCTDINAHWLLNVLLNSDESLAGRFGLSKEIDICNGDNAPLIPGLNHHFENGQAVEKCTRNARKFLPSAEGISVARHICLKEYSFSVKANMIHQIEIESLPDGYTEDDLLYQSSNDETATVDSGGCVHGVSAGSAVITIRTKDDKHMIRTHVIVPEN